MSDWGELTSAALLGTGRSKVVPRLPGEFQALLEHAQAEVQLLRAAGVLQVAHRAGMILNTATPLHEVASPEELRVVTAPALVSLLTRIIEEGRPAVLREACAMLVVNGHCLPARLLPRALELGRKTVAIREPLREVLGKRGAWLAAQNSDWKFALLSGTDQVDSRLWDEGDIEQRARFLAELRKENASAARELLEKSFAGETARDRASLLPALGEGLSLADEAFLSETLANDRSKEVRQSAALLLSRMPQSAFAQRMADRLRACVTKEKKLLKSALSIEPPAAYDPAWKSDTIEEKLPAGSQFGERAWWLAQLVSLTPLSWWETETGLPPSEILPQLLKSEWKQALLNGLHIAMANQPGHHDWTVALLERGGVPHQEAIELALKLPGQQADEALQRILGRSDDSGVAAQIIESAEFPWSDALWMVAKQKLPAWLSQQDWRFRSALALLAARIPANHLQDEFTWPDLPIFAEAFADFSRIQDQRRTLHQILRKS